MAQPSHANPLPSRIDAVLARLARLERRLLPLTGAARLGAGQPAEYGRYALVAALIGLAALIGFLPSLPINGVPIELWLPYFAAVFATAAVVSAGLLLPRPESRLSVVGAIAAALAIAALNGAIDRYFSLGPIVFTVMVLVVAIIQGVRASLAMVAVGTVVLPFMANPTSAPHVDDFPYSFAFLMGLAATVWAYRRLQARSASALEASESRYRELVERMPGVVYECAPGLNGAWTYVSPRIELVLGFPAARFTEDPGFWWSRIHADDRELVAAQEAALEVEAGAERNVTEYRMLDASGGVRWISDEATLIRDTASGSQTWSGILIDITAEKELEQRLRQAQRSEAVGQLAGGIAHDFNNLLTVIRGYGALIRGDAVARGDDTADADELIRAADRATALTGQLLTFGRRQVLQPRILDPAAVVGELTPMLRRLIGDHVTLVATGPVEPVFVSIDRSQLEQVVVNLAINARDAMPDGGHLTIAVDRFAPPRRRSKDGLMARISVTDTGLGMDELVRAQIFEPFFTTKSLGRGTGLGLPTVLGIVSQAGGRITCDSQPGHGTTFQIDLPTVDPPEAVADSRDGASSVDGAPAGHGRVLLVEDQAPVRQVTVRMLVTLGYEVVEAPGGIEALMALEREPKLALLISDVTMPGMLGPELAQRVVQRRPGLPVLLITGYAGEGRSAVDNGPFPVLAKPFDLVALARAARATIEGTPGGVG